MRRFAELYQALDRTTRTSEKVSALRGYFRDAPPEDSAWALTMLLGRRGRRPISGARLRAWVAERAKLPEWLVETCYDTVGDLAETLALLLPEPAVDALPPPPLHEVFETWILPLTSLDDDGKRARIESAWARLDPTERLVFHKLLTGGFRVGVSSGLVLRALGEETAIEPAVLAHRILGPWSPTAQAFQRLCAPDEGAADPARPYPFLLAHPIDETESGGLEATLHPDRSQAHLTDPTPTPIDLTRWLFEWKWDGIRAQLVVRSGARFLWSRGEEVISEAFPELIDAAEAFVPEGTVLDGEILPWRPKDEIPLPFGDLQRRLGRKAPSRKLQLEIPVRFLAYDLLERDGIDLRSHPLRARRAQLEALLAPIESRTSAFSLSPAAPTPPDAQAALRLRDSARDLRAEGLMVKDLDGAYGVGRPRGLWWKWKVTPFTLDTVLLYAQKGHGRRANLYTDYTLGVWDTRTDPPTLVPVAKAYSGLTDPELAAADRWIRRHRTERFGPVQGVEPGLVFEIAFEGIRASPRHRSGIALRFPRIARWRIDKPATEADTLDAVQRLLANEGP